MPIWGFLSRSSLCTRATNIHCSYIIYASLKDIDIFSISLYTDRILLEPKSGFLQGCYKSPCQILPVSGRISCEITITITSSGTQYFCILQPVIFYLLYIYTNYVTDRSILLLFLFLSQARYINTPCSKSVNYILCPSNIVETPCSLYTG